MNADARGGEHFLLPRFQRALDREGNTHDWRHIIQAIASGEAQFWHTQDGRGAIVTELRRYPNLMTVNYWLAAGDFAACRSLVPAIEKWAIAEGATRATGGGRPGFARLLAADGVTVAGVMFRKELMP